MEEWTAHNPSDAGFHRAGSGESYGRSPIMSTSHQSHCEQCSRAQCNYMKVMQKPREREMFLWFPQIAKRFDTSFLPKEITIRESFKQEGF